MDKLDYTGDGKIHYTEWRKFALEAIEENLNSERHSKGNLLTLYAAFYKERKA